MSDQTKTKASYVCFDIETLPTARPAAVAKILEEVGEQEPPKSVTKEAKEIWDILGESYPDAKTMKTLWKTERVKQARLTRTLRRTALDTALAEVACLCVRSDHPDWKKMSYAFPLGPLDHCVMDGEEMSDDSDSSVNLFWGDIITDLNEIAGPETWWVGHNIEGFDLPILLNTFTRRGLVPPTYFPRYSHGRWHGRVYDTMAKFPSKTPFIKMTEVCDFYGITGAKSVVDGRGSPIDGSKVCDVWMSGDWESVVLYCEQDVEMEEQIFFRMTAGGMYGIRNPTDDVAERLADIDQSDMNEGQKAIAQVGVIKAAGLWPRLKVA